MSAISYYPTDEFNPTLKVHITDGGDYEFTLKECCEKLLVFGSALIFKKDIDLWMEKWGYELYGEPSLYDLLNYEFIRDAPEEYWEWFKQQAALRR